MDPNPKRWAQTVLKKMAALVTCAACGRKVPLAKTINWQGEHLCRDTMDCHYSVNAEV